MLLGIDIGGSKIRLSLSDINNPTSINKDIKVKTPIGNPSRISNIILEAIEELGVPITSIHSVGIASPAPINKVNGIISMPNNMQWDNYNIFKSLDQIFECPIALEHDASLGALYEGRIGAANSYKKTMYLTVSTGIGAGLYMNGELTVRNIEPGRMIIYSDYMYRNGILGTFENVVSGKAIVRRFSSLASELNDLMAWDEISKDLALGLYNIIVNHDLDIITIGGGVGVHFHKYSKLLNHHLDSYSFKYSKPVITQADQPDHAPVLGALILASDIL